MRKFTKSKIAYITIIVITIVCILFLLIRPTSQSHIAQIWVNGKIVKEIDLEKADDIEFSINTVTFKIENHKIRFIDSDCPDKICINTGYIYNSTESAHCLPNKISLTII